MSECLDLSIAANHDDLVRAMGRIEEFLAGHATAPAVDYAAQLAFEELATNVIKYSGARAFEAHLDLGPPAQLTLRDAGRPFDPWHDAAVPDLDQALEDRPIGGLGLHMVREMAAEVAYERRNNANVVTVTFKEETEQ